MVSEMRTTVRTVGECQPMDVAGLWPSSPIRSPSLRGKGLGDGLIDLPPNPLPARKGELIGRVMEMMSEMRTTVRTVGERQPMDIVGIWPSSPIRSPSLAGKGLGDGS
jgi:hypothetical protein